MFIEKEDLYTAICEYQLQNITTSAVTIRMACLLYTSPSPRD